MNKIITSVFLLLSFLGFAQTADSVMSMGGAMDVYYDFETQTKVSVDRSTWDIGLTTDPQSASIIINENAGTELFLYSSDISDWDNVDTTGQDWTNIYNSEATWRDGAFSNQGTAHPDYGWGIYNMNTHDIVGNRIFILKNNVGVYWKVMIPAMRANGDFEIRVGAVDNASDFSYQFNKSDENEKHFHLMKVDNSLATISTNPDAARWDLLFTKYITFIQQGPSSRFQPVGGVKIAPGCQVAQRDGVSITSDDTSSLTWNTNITEIGWDWKTFEFPSSYIMVADRTYFVRTQNGAVYKLWFDNYTVGTANYFFNTKQIKGAVLGTAKVSSLNTKVYPNPTKDVLNISNKENEALSIMLMNAQGAVVYTSNVNANEVQTISTAALAKGIYFLQLSTANATSTKRVIFE